MSNPTEHDPDVVDASFEPVNPRESELVQSLAHLVRLAKERRSVFLYGRPLAAAFAIGMPGLVIHEMISRGLPIYPKPAGKKSRYGKKIGE